MRQRRYRVQETIDALHARAAAALVSDDRAERIRNRAPVGCAIVGVASVVVFLGGLAGQAWWSPRAMDYAVPAAFLLFVSGLVLGIGVYAFYGRYDLDDRKVTTLHKLLAVLRADVPAQALVDVDVDFRDYRKGRLVRKDAGFWSSRRSYVYAHPWLLLQAPLADGSRIHVQVTDHVKRKEKSKRKYTKVREAARSRIRIALRLGKAYADPATLVDGLRQARPPGQTRLLGVEARGRTLVASFLSRPDARSIGRAGTGSERSLSPSDADTLLHALRWVYRGLSRPAA